MPWKKTADNHTSSTYKNLSERPILKKIKFVYEGYYYLEFSSAKQAKLYEYEFLDGCTDVSIYSDRSVFTPNRIKIEVMSVEQAERVFKDLVFFDPTIREILPDADTLIDSAVQIRTLKENLNQANQKFAHQMGFFPSSLQQNPGNNQEVIPLEFN